jgi:hypothetical protein
MILSCREIFESLPRDKTSAEPHGPGDTLPSASIKVHKGSHHHETPGCSENNGDRRPGGRR